MTTLEKSNSRFSGFIILSACLLLLLSFGYRSGFGLFVKPVSEANTWGREIISMALAVQNLFWGIIAVFAGGLADRFGNVKVIIMGTILYALGMLLMSGIHEPAMAKRKQTVPDTLREALGHTSYLLLVTGFFVCGFHVAFITAHMPAFLTDMGFKASVGAWSISIIGLCNVFGAYSSGILSGKIFKRYVLVFIYLGRSVAYH
jgi:MFS family permease